MSEQVKRVQRWQPCSTGDGGVSMEATDNPKGYIDHFAYDALAARVAELEANEGLNSNHYVVDALKAENAKLRIAVEWYADADQWRPRPLGGGAETTPILADRGHLARTALAALAPATPERQEASEP